IIALLISPLPAADVPRTSPVGQTVPRFELRDYLGAAHSWDEWSQKKAVVVAFLGVECPLAKQYGPRLAELAAKYEPLGAAFIGIDANQQDSLLEIAHFAR